MKSRKKLLKKSRLYLILDKKTCGKPLVKTAAKILRSKIGVVQLRSKCEDKNAVLKDAIELSRVFKDSAKIFIINDYPEIARIAGCDGVHLGQDDLPVRAARKLLGASMIIGVSCHSLRQALAAQKQGADYIGIGPVFATRTKPDYRPIGLETLKKLKGRIRIPYFAIGDIRKENIRDIAASGARRAAVCRAILKSNNIGKTAGQLLKGLDH